MLVEEVLVVEGEEVLVAEEEQESQDSKRHSLRRAQKVEEADGRGLKAAASK